MSEKNKTNEEQLETDDQQQGILDMLSETEEPEVEVDEIETEEEILDDTESDEETVEDDSSAESEELEETEEEEVETTKDVDEVTDELETTETELTETELLQQRNEELLKIIEQGVTTSLSTPKETSSEPETTVETVKPVETASSPTLAELVGDIDFNEMQDDPSKFVELLQKVVDHTRTTTVNSLQAELPKMVTDRATQAVSLHNLVDDFYRENNDLSAVKKTVSAVAQNVSAENPDMGMVEVLAKAATKTRTLLGIKQTKAKSNKPIRKGKKPAILKAKGKHKAAPKKVSKLQQDINDLIKF